MGTLQPPSMKHRPIERIAFISRSRTTFAILKDALVNASFDVTFVSDKDPLPSGTRLIVLECTERIEECFRLCSRLRDNLVIQPVCIIMLASSLEETDEIVASNMGADDFVIKPIRVQAFIERLRSHLRRTKLATTPKDQITLHGLKMSKLAMSVQMDGIEIQMSRTEFFLLWTLVKSPGRIFSRTELTEQSRGIGCRAHERTIDVRIRVLRKKLGRDDLIQTVHGAGYRFRQN